MEATIPGVSYQLKNFNSDDYQEIVFVSKDKDGYHKGTTNEEVINMMIDRFYNLQKKSYSVENQLIIENLKSIRRSLAKRLTKKIDKLKSHPNGSNNSHLS